MSPTSTEKLRSSLLFLTGAIFLGIAVAGVFAPRQVAAWYALELMGTDGLNEYRAVFIGFWTGLFLMMAYAAKNPENVALGDFAAVLVLCQSLGRWMSLHLDGWPSAKFIGWMIGEMTISLAILALSPTTRAAFRRGG